MLPVATRLKAFWDRLVDHTDPEDAFRRTVTDALTHLETDTHNRLQALEGAAGLDDKFGQAVHLMIENYEGDMAAFRKTAAAPGASGGPAPADPAQTEGKGPGEPEKEGAISAPSTEKAPE